MAYKNPEDAKRWHEKNKPRKHAYMRQYRIDNLEKVTESSRRTYRKNKAKYAPRRRAYAKKNAAHIKAYKERWNEKNRERLNEKSKAYQILRRETDENFKIKGALRCRLYAAIKKAGAKKSANTMALVGCDIQFLRGFLEARFLTGMTWRNHGTGNGKWHVDHHIPCAEFDLRDPAQQRQCFNYSNLRPMWGPENQSKGAKRPSTHQAEII